MTSGNALPTDGQEYLDSVNSGKGKGTSGWPKGKGKDSKGGGKGTKGKGKGKNGAKGKVKHGGCNRCSDMSNWARDCPQKQVNYVGNDGWNTDSNNGNHRVELMVSNSPFQ